MNKNETLEENYKTASRVSGNLILYLSYLDTLIDELFHSIFM